MKLIFIILVSTLLGGCFSTPAINVSNICDLMDDKVSWYQAIKASEKKYKAPKHIQLAIIYQESHFASDAQPPRDKLFGVIPWFRTASAYGFAQAKDTTWNWYQQKTNNYNAERDNFKDASDFVGWYINQSNQRAGISKNDAYRQYLAYHEGHNGFAKKSYLAKPWLLKVAKSVADNAKIYKNQLQQCQSRLDKNRVWRFF